MRTWFLGLIQFQGCYWPAESNTMGMWKFCEDNSWLTYLVTYIMALSAIQIFNLQISMEYLRVAVKLCICDLVMIHTNNISSHEYKSYYNYATNLSPTLLNGLTLSNTCTCTLHKLGFTKVEPLNRQSCLEYTCTLQTPRFTIHTA